MGMPHGREQGLGRPAEQSWGQHGGGTGSWLPSQRPFLYEGGWSCSSLHIPAAAAPFQPVLTCSHGFPACPRPSSQC